MTHQWHDDIDQLQAIIDRMTDTQDDLLDLE